MMPATSEPQPQPRPGLDLGRCGVCWVDGRAASAEAAADPALFEQQYDATDLARALVNYSAEMAAGGPRGRPIQGAGIDRKPHKQRISADFGGKLNDGGPKTRLGGHNTAAMLSGQGPGARGLRWWWDMLDSAVNESVCAGDKKLIQMFVFLGSGVGLGATSGEAHADAARCRVTGEHIGARGTVHFTADPARAEREFRVAAIQLEKRSSGDASLRLTEDSLQPSAGLDGRRHLPEPPLSVSRYYRNLDVSLLNAEGLGVVRGKDGCSQTGHEGGLRPLGGRPMADLGSTLHGGIVFSIDRSPTAEEMTAIVNRVAAAAAAGHGRIPAMRVRQPDEWAAICADNGAALFAAATPRLRRLPFGASPSADGGAGGSRSRPAVAVERVGLAVGYRAAGYTGPGEHYDPSWTSNCEAREKYGSDSVEGQVFLALDTVRIAAGLAGIDGNASSAAQLFAPSGRPHAYSRAGRTDKRVDALCNVMTVPLELSLLGDGSAAALKGLVAAINAKLPPDIRLFQVFRTAAGFNAKQYCEYRQYEMLIPCRALLPPLAARQCATDTQVIAPWPVVWRADGAKAVRRQGMRGLLAAPVRAAPGQPSFRVCSVDGSDGDGSGYWVEWTQRRRLCGTQPPMIRIAILCSIKDGVSARSGGQWYASAVGEGRCHARGAALEFFGCGALPTVSAEDGQPQQQWDLRALSLSSRATTWRRIDYETLRLLDTPPVPLPAAAHVIQLGLWCDCTPVDSTHTTERCPCGSTVLLAPDRAAGNVGADGACRPSTTEGRPAERREPQQGQGKDPFALLELGVLQMVREQPCSGADSHLVMEPAPEPGLGSHDIARSTTTGGTFGGLPFGAAAMSARLEPILRLLEGDQYFHNFNTPGLKPTQKKCRRKLAHAACASFLLQRPASAAGVSDNSEFEPFVQLSFTAKGFLFDQVYRMAGCIAAVASGAWSVTQMQNALRTDVQGALPPRAPSGGLMLVSCSYSRKLPPRPVAPSSPIWVGPRAGGGAGSLWTFAGDSGCLLDWRAEVLASQARAVGRAWALPNVGTVWDGGSAGGLDARVDTEPKSITE